MVKCRMCLVELEVRGPVTVPGHYSTTDGGLADVYLENGFARVSWAECEPCSKSADSRTTEWVTRTSEKYNAS